MIQKEVIKTPEGVEVNFSGAIAKEQVFTMVQNCQKGQCECMSDATKEKLSSIEVSGEDGNVTLELSGEITTDEIQAALEKSKIIS